MAQELSSASNTSDAGSELIVALNDPDEWGGPEPTKQPRSEKRRRGIVVSVRFSPEEFAEVETRAGLQQIPIGTYLRQCALTAGVTGVVHATVSTRQFLQNSAENVPESRLSVSTEIRAGTSPVENESVGHRTYRVSA